MPCGIKKVSSIYLFIAYLSVFAHIPANTTAIITLVVTFGAETWHIFADTNFVRNLFGLPQVETSISFVIRVAVFVSDDFESDHNTAYSPGTSDSFADTSNAKFGFAYASTSTSLTPKFAFPVSSACPT